MADDPTFKIPNEVIQPIIQAKVQEAMVAALGNQAQILTAAVNRILQMKVDNEGRQTNYSNSISFIQWLLDGCIRTAAKEAVLEMVKGHQENIKAALIKELGLEKNKRLTPLAKDMIDGLVKGMAELKDYQIRVEVSKRQNY